ncbi:hypothetical protein R3P38DRAFT_2788404 [Favolaschia claudopus]|uniref:Uncharacterized protein n=1 Tax=Favolaschia claudopus TaxID=2862362 RepID=A0AAW0AKD1_9AGAR
MPATTSRLRSLLPKTPSMTQPEPFLLSRTMEREGNLGELSAVSGAPVEIRANPVSRKSRNQSESERRSAGQKRRRKREAKEKENDGRLVRETCADLRGTVRHCKACKLATIIGSTSTSATKARW